MHNFTLTQDGEGIAILAFDVPGRTMNTLTASAIADLESFVERLRGDASIRGVVLASGKSNAFCAGADLGELGDTAGAGLEGEALARALHTTSRTSRVLRALETCGKPVAAAIEGLALGGGCELVLAAHYRVGVRGKVRLGLPEVTIGLLPGAGGTQRLPRLIGAAKALDMMLKGDPIDGDGALAIGLIDALVEPGEAIAAARAWILAGGDSVQPWDRKGFSVPGGPYTPAANPAFTLASARVAAQCHGNYPAQRNILRCVYEGFGMPMDAALKVEARLFLATHQTPQARAMIRSLFLSKQALAKGAARPDGFAQYRVGKAAVLGAGMMGAGIAYAQARAGIGTVLIDVTCEAAEKGKDYSRTLVEKATAKGTMNARDAAALVERIEATDDYARIAGADLVVEAVFEERALKADVTRHAEAVLGDGAVLASNTSTLPIDSLADAVDKPENFIGLHFFSPVDRMELVEVIVGRRTSPETLAKAIDYCRQLKKVPIVVNDSRGFYTSRVFDTYLREGFEMLLEGIAPAIVDNAGRMSGMPRGPLELADDVAIDLLDRIFRQRRVDLGITELDPTDSLVAEMVARGRLGRKNGRGFYDYGDDGKRLWTELGEVAPVRRASVEPAELEMLRQRLLYRQAVEAARCIDEGVVTAARDADVGAILGWGFAPWTGGPISLIDGVGIATFVARCDLLAQQHGPRFTPPALLRRMMTEGSAFYPSSPASRIAA